MVLPQNFLDLIAWDIARYEPTLGASCQLHHCELNRHNCHPCYGRNKKECQSLQSSLVRLGTPLKKASSYVKLGGGADF